MVMYSLNYRLICILDRFQALYAYAVELLAEINLNTH